MNTAKATCGEVREHRMIRNHTGGGDIGRSKNKKNLWRSRFPSLIFFDTYPPFRLYLQFKFTVSPFIINLINFPEISEFLNTQLCSLEHYFKLISARNNFKNYIQHRVAKLKPKN